MKKILMFNVVSVDGYFAGTDGNIDWHRVDDEFNAYAEETLSRVGTILFGRVTYQLFESYWPDALKDPATEPEDRHIAQAIHDATKIVFSKSMKTAPAWHNSRLMHNIDAQAIRKLCEQPGKDIIVYGSGTIVQQLTALRLIDEYRFMVTPVILGAGKRLFADMAALGLTLSEARPFRSGNVLLVYRPA